MLKKYLVWFVLLALQASFSAYGFDISSLWQKNYKTQDQCNTFSPNVDGQREFVQLICQALFDSSRIGDTQEKRLLCLRREIEKARSRERSIEVMYTCYQKFPLKDSFKHHQVIIALSARFFPSPEQLEIRREMQNALSANRPQIVIPMFDCFTVGNMTSCF